MPGVIVFYLFCRNHGAAAGRTGGGVPPFKILGGRHPKIPVLTELFKELSKQYIFFKVFKIKLPNSEDKSELGGRRV